MSKQDQRLASIRFLAERYEKQGREKRFKHWLKANRKAPTDREGARREEAIVRTEAINAVAEDERFMGDTALYLAWKQYETGDWRFLEDEFDDFLDYMRNGVKRYSRGYREDLWRIIMRIFAWVNKPATKVYLEEKGKERQLITVDLIFDRVTVLRMKTLSHLFETDDEEARKRHLIYLITNIKEDDDSQDDADREYEKENGDDALVLPKLEVEVLPDKLRNLYMRSVDDRQFGLIQMLLNGAEVVNYIPDADADEDGEEDEDDDEVDPIGEEDEEPTPAVTY